MQGINCVKSVRIRSLSGRHLPSFGRNTQRYEVSFRVQSESRRMRTRKTPNTDTFHAVIIKSSQDFIVSDLLIVPLVFSCEYC